MLAYAQTQVINQTPDYVFGRQIIFRANVETTEDISDASFYFQRPEDSAPNRIPVKVDDQGKLEYEYDNMRYPLRAFSPVDYWFEVTTLNGETIRSDKEEFIYADNRFTWNSLLEGPFHVNWYEGNADFGSELMTVAQRGLQLAKTWLPLTSPDDKHIVNIYVYASAQELRSTNMLAGTNCMN